MAHQLLQEQTFPPGVLITRTGCFTRRRVCFSYKGSFGSCCYSDPCPRSFRSAQPSTWQHFANLLALTRPRCLRLSCELSARSTGSSLLFLALSECWLSALLFCLLSLHFCHVFLHSAPFTRRLENNPPPIRACDMPLNRCWKLRSYACRSDKLLSHCGVKNARAACPGLVWEHWCQTLARRPKFGLCSVILFGPTKPKELQASNDYTAQIATNIPKPRILYWRTGHWLKGINIIMPSLVYCHMCAVSIYWLCCIKHCSVQCSGCLAPYWKIYCCLWRKIFVRWICQNKTLSRMFEYWSVLDWHPCLNVATTQGG